MFSVIIPVYKNEAFIHELMIAFGKISSLIKQRFELVTEFVFVVDASPDRCYDLLSAVLPLAPFRSQLIVHTRNFGSFAAIRTGLKAAKGEFFGVVAADLQEPPELLINFLEALTNQSSDIVIGVRKGRNDPLTSKTVSNLFWNLYRRLIIKEIPKGGVDIFACNQPFRDELLKMEEAHSSLIGLIFWLGFRRSEVMYERQVRAYGKSAWTLSKKISYLFDSIFAFTDLPVRILSILGILGLSVSIVLGMTVSLLKLFGDVAVPGYAATILVITFFGGLNTFGLGLVGSYVWRTYENTKHRPLSIVQVSKSFKGKNILDINVNDHMECNQ